MAEIDRTQWCIDNWEAVAAGERRTGYQRNGRQRRCTEPATPQAAAGLAEVFAAGSRLPGYRHRSVSHRTDYRRRGDGRNRRQAGEAWHPGGTRSPATSSAANSSAVESVRCGPGRRACQPTDGAADRHIESCRGRVTGWPNCRGSGCGPRTAGRSWTGRLNRPGDRHARRMPPLGSVALACGQELLAAGAVRPRRAIADHRTAHAGTMTRGRSDHHPPPGQKPPHRRYGSAPGYLPGYGAFRRELILVAKRAGLRPAGTSQRSNLDTDPHRSRVHPAAAISRISDAANPLVCCRPHRAISIRALTTSNLALPRLHQGRRAPMALAGRAAASPTAPSPGPHRPDACYTAPGGILPRAAPTETRDDRRAVAAHRDDEP